MDTYFYDFLRIFQLDILLFNPFMDIFIFSFYKSKQKQAIKNYTSNKNVQKQQQQQQQNRLISLNIYNQIELG